MGNFLRALTATGLLAVILLSAIRPALALEAPGGVGVMPIKEGNGGWFVYTVDPGAVIEDEAKIINNDSKPQTINVDVEDAGSLADGGFALAGKENSTEIGVWTELEKHQVTVPANSFTTVKFKITLPADAGVGEHAGGLVVWRADNTPDSTTQLSSGAKVNVISRVGARIYITVRGDVKQQLKVTSKKYLVRQGELHFIYKIKNLGNIRTEPLAETSLYGIFGPAGKAQIQGPQISPNKEATIDLKWPKRAPLFGPYLAIVKLHDNYQVPAGLNVVQPAHDVRVLFFMFLIPWGVASWVLLILAFLWLLYQFIVWRKLARIASMPVKIYRIKRGETLPEISARYGLPWKLVATVNDLKPPYVVKEGDSVELPDPTGSRSSHRVPNFFVLLARPFSWVGRILNRKTKLRAARPSALSEPAYEMAVVDRGDTLADVAAFFHVTPQSIITLNKLTPPYKLRPNQELKIPKSKLSGRSHGGNTKSQRGKK